MELLIQNRSRLKIDLKKIKRWVSLILKKPGYQDSEISILFVDDEEIRVLNKNYRGKDRTTDVLSFSQLEEVKNSKLQTPNIEAPLGQDLAIKLGDSIGTNKLVVTDSINNLLLTIHPTAQGAALDLPKGYICLDDDGTCAIQNPQAGTLYADRVEATSISLANNIQINGDLISPDGTLNEAYRDQVLTAEQVQRLVELEVAKQLASLTTDYGLRTTAVDGSQSITDCP